MLVWEALRSKRHNPSRLSGLARILTPVFSVGRTMSKSDRDGNSSVASFPSTLIVGSILATGFYYFQPCACKAVAQHVPWLVRIIGVTPVCLAIGFTLYLINRWGVRKPEDALGTAIVLSPIFASGALGYWLTDSWLWALFFSACAFGVLVVIFSKGSNETPKPPNGNTGGGPLLLLEYHPASDDSDNGGEAARLAACATG
jgi:hypothetical protein